jgi:hypothetical protein
VVVSDVADPLFGFDGSSYQNRRKSGTIPNMVAAAMMLEAPNRGGKI